MEVRERTDDLWLVLQHDTALDLGGLQLVERVERLVGDAFIGQGPQALTRLQFGRIGRQEEQMDALGHHQLVAGMPARLIEDQQHSLGGACTDSLGEVRQRQREHIRSHGRQEQPFGLSGSWLHKRVDIEPLEALLHRHSWSRPFAHPDAAQDRLEPDAMLIGGPQLHCGIRERLLQLVQALWKVFLKASWVVGSALACRGRSTHLL